MFFIIPEIADGFYAFFSFLFFLARLLPAVTSASVATVFFSRVFMFCDINNILSYTDLT